MKVIFLDIDGVLNTADLLHEGGIHTIAPHLVANLHRIVAATGAEIVLSSTWRLHQENRRRVNQALEPFGMQFSHRTESMRHTPRRDEIREWLGRHPEVTHFAVIDDESDACIPGHFIHTSFTNGGLTSELADRAIEVLNSEASKVA